MKSLMKWFFFLLLFVPAFLIGSQFLYPNVSHLEKVNPPKTAMMEIREREWRSEGKRYAVRQKWVSLDAISPYLVKAVLIGEDDKFWDHSGFDFDALQEAVQEDLRRKKFKRGGSTITQQLAKNLFLAPSKNLFRKMREAILTWRLERSLSKARILEIYLNVAEWGDRGIFGIEAAAERYYSKPASDLTAEESARLAAVLPKPRKYSPIGKSLFVENRSRHIYDIMVKRGIVAPEESDFFLFDFFK